MSARRAVSRAVRLVTAVVVAGALVSCASSQPGTGPEGATGGDGSAAPGEQVSGEPVFPRVVEIPAGEHLPAAQVEIEAWPERVVTLTYETTELVAALGVGDRLVLIPEAARTEVLTNHPEVTHAVAATFPSESSVNTEAVLAVQPDLVLLSARHGLESGVGQAIAAAGVPVLTLPNSWQSYEDMVLNIDLVARALGTEDVADELTAELRDAGVLDAGGLDAGAADPEASVPEPPRILVLSNQAGRPFVVGGSAFPLELVRLAGGVDAGADLGITRTGPIAVEQVVQADPDGILLIDMSGGGRESFDAVMAGPVVAGIDAVARGNVILLEARHAQALGLADTVTGLESLRDWIADL